MKLIGHTGIMRPRRLKKLIRPIEFLGLIKLIGQIGFMRPIRLTRLIRPIELVGLIKFIRFRKLIRHTKLL